MPFGRIIYDLREEIYLLFSFIIHSNVHKILLTYLTILVNYIPPF